MSYLYFGSKLGKEGVIIEIFFKYNIVFAYLDSKDKIFNYGKYDIGTKIAVTEGQWIKAVGETIEKFTSLDKLNIDFAEEKLSIFNAKDQVLAVKVKLYKLEEKDCFQYEAANKRVEPIYARKDIREKIDSLLKKYSGELAMEEYIKLLQNNYNLILTGAPGTGKTYLAKQIAAKMISDEEYTKKLEEDENFKNQCMFVQFHPSYDYTDFVEGLRPIKDSNDNICFERKDGVFKEFCKEALRNLIDSKKDVSELNKETIIKDNLSKFINEIRENLENSNKFPLKGIGGGEVAPIIEIDDKDAIINFSVKTEEKTHNIKLKNIIEMYNSFTKEPSQMGGWKYKDLEKLKYFKGYTTYKYGFLKAFYEKYNSKIIEELKNGATTVEKVERKNFVFIIDEINRGEISKIFGELFFAIDPGYRGIKGKVLTQYSNLIDEDEEKYFYIPENVYIIGTMNDIDRSVESMDFAMRRRFAWKEVKAADTQDMLDGILNTAILDDTKKRMNNLNKAIEEIEGFNSSYHIGASYFLKLKNYYNDNNEKEAFKSLWDNHLKGLLFEYLRGMPDAESKLDKLKSIYDKVSNNNETQNNNTAEDSNVNPNDNEDN